MNFTTAEFGNLTRLEFLPPSHRQARFLGPLLGFFLASLFPNLAIARLHQGSIKFQYDPLPTLHPHQLPSISVYQTPEPTWVPVTEPPEEFQLESTGEPHHPVTYPDIFPTTLESPSEYLTPKVSVKRSIPSRYLSSAYRRNNRYSIRRRYPEYLDYDNYDYATTPRLRNRIRNQGRRPIGLDYDYDYDYDYGNKGQRRKQQRRRIKNKNRKGADYDSEEDFDDDVESVTPVLKPRQQQTTTTRPTTTTTDATTMPTSTTITNGSTPSTTTSNNATTAYGYGPYSGNENISITYGPPSAVKPVYGVPGAAYGAPLSEWAPSYVYESPSSYHSHRYRPSSYHSPTLSYASPNSYSSTGSGSSSYSSYGTPGSTYGTPSVTYSKPYATYSHSSSYGPPSTSYGIPNQSYGVPGSSVNQPQGSPGSRATNYQNYQLPFSSWYGRSASHSDIVKRVQDIIRYD